MTDKDISKFLSLVLRHQPEKLNIRLDEAGWTDVSILLAQLKIKNMPVDFDRLKRVVDTNDKKRFAFNDDFSKIRARGILLR